MDLIRKFTCEYEDYLRDESRIIGSADAIAFPKTEAEIIEIVKNCVGKKIPLTVQGGRTGLTAAAVPEGGQIINLSRMTKITAARYDADQNFFFLTVQPGLLLAELRKAIANKSFDISEWDEPSCDALSNFSADKWTFTPDPTESSAAIGGMIACNASGARSFYFGAVRPYVESLRIVLSDGDLLEIRRGESFANKRSFSMTTVGGRTISGQLPSYQMPTTKNAAGYFITDNMDLIDLFIGSEGTLGIISAAEIRLLPSAPVVWGISSFFNDENTALRFVRALRQEQLPDIADVFYQRPVAIEFFNHSALALLKEQKQHNPAFSQIQEIKEGSNCAVFTEFHSDNEDYMWQLLRDLLRLREQLGEKADNTWVATNSRDMEKLLFFRHAVPESVNMLIDLRRQSDATISKLGTDMAVPDCYLNSAMEMYNSDLTANQLDYAIWGHIGNNHLHVNILPRNAEDYRLGKELYSQWASKISSWGGTVSAEHGIGKLKKTFLLLMYGEENVAQMCELKRLFDPLLLINRGNIFA